MATTVNNKRIAKNTILLYFRTLLIMAITLYTSRVILNALGVKDYGIYNVVGGVVAMFSLLSGSLSNAISRYITFELGRGDTERLKIIFSTSVNIQAGLSLLIMLLGVVGGGWFLNTHMSIPSDRLVAANWVLYCSLLMFCINLISIPYNACIIAHERMTAFAYVSILEASLKLLVCYIIVISPFDKLISYAVLLVIVAFVIRLVYGLYCNRHFAECHYKFVHDKALLKQMGSFAGWQFLTHTSWLFNTQGVNILINLYFGVALNAARGIATQVDAAVQQFVSNFMTAINPQITKCYAIGDIDNMFKLVCRGAKFSYYLLLFFALPIMLETDYILTLWLKNVPDYTVLFLRLTIIGSMLNILGNSLLTACMATGNIKKYTIWVSSVGVLVFPLTILAYECGSPVESTYVIFILVYIAVLLVKILMSKKLLNFPPVLFIREVLLKIIIITPFAVILPYLVIVLMPEESFERLIITTLTCLFSISCVIYLLGLSNSERTLIKEKAILKYRRFLHK